MASRFLAELISRRNLLKSSGLLALGGAIPRASASPVACATEPDLPGIATGANIYESIGVRPIVNCRGTFTIICGSQTLPEVKKAMDEASRYYVQVSGPGYTFGRAPQCRRYLARSNRAHLRIGRAPILVEQTGNVLHGVHEGETIRGDLHGTVHADQVKLASLHPIHGTVLEYRFSGQADGDVMQGTVSMEEYGAARWSAKRHAYSI